MLLSDFFHINFNDFTKFFKVHINCWLKKPYIVVKNNKERKKSLQEKIEKNLVTTKKLEFNRK